MPEDFRRATDALLSCISHSDLAEALGCSVATVRQARLGEGAKAHRNPPDDWKWRVRLLAERQAAHFIELADSLST